jgi:hypothetical protein
VDAPTQVILNLFLQQDIALLRSLRDEAFDAVSGGEGTLVSSSVNGSSFTFSVPSSLSKMQVMTFAQMALDHRARNICRPVTRTQALFN